MKASEKPVRISCLQEIGVEITWSKAGRVARHGRRAYCFCLELCRGEYPTGPPALYALTYSPTKEQKSWEFEPMSWRILNSQDTFLTLKEMKKALLFHYSHFPLTLPSCTMKPAAEGRGKARMKWLTIYSFWTLRTWIGDMERQAWVRCKLAFFTYPGHFYLVDKSESHLLFIVGGESKEWNLLLRDIIKNEFSPLFHSLSLAIL